MGLSKRQEERDIASSILALFEEENSQFIYIHPDLNTPAAAVLMSTERFKKLLHDALLDVDDDFYKTYLMDHEHFEPSED